MRRANELSLIVLLWPLGLGAQSSTELRQILERLDRLERTNQALAEEVRSLRAELAGARAAPPTDVPATAASANLGTADLPERLDIAEKRIEEQAQTKLESSQRFPIRITGMALFNMFSNSEANGGSDYPGIAATGNRHRAGATIRQTVIGLEYRGPQTVWGGKVQGSVFMDFFGAPAQPLNETMRVRTGSIEINWKSRGIMAGLEKPIFNPREPQSLARVGVSPLTGAGNLWLWIPQVRFEQDLQFTRASGLRAQVGVVQTREVGPYNEVSSVETESARPGLEGRFEWFYRFDDRRRAEIAPGFHTSTSHAGGASIPSSVFSLDWFFNPWQRVEFTGAFYTGKNVAHLGTGSVRQGFSFYGRVARPVHSRGGWGQVTLHATSRVSLHLLTGQLDDRNSDLNSGSLGKNLVFGGNLFYSLAPNVIVAVEATQTRSNYINTNILHNNHYDLALAYRF